MNTEKRKIWWVAGIALVLAMPLTFMLINKGAPISWGLWTGVNRDRGIAIDGYDPVAFHTASKAIRGVEAFSHEWNGARWHFVDDDHRARFAADPERYAPAFGGYCATAASAGLTFDTDPRVWHIENGELFLFFNADARDDFLKQLDAGVIARAHRNYRDGMR
ncbi:MAG: hypothetical protein DWQ08_09325 [Proteobacteria bacterium]|nr:MAG: hypothetical protein DWQ08_09325 [Pseudomonadota bacterium]